MPTESGPGIDVLYVVALEEELVPARDVVNGPFLGHPGVAEWLPRDSEDATPWERGEFVLDGGPHFSVALAQLPRMGPVAASGTLATLIERLHPRCLVMSGVCAGRPGLAAYGDVIVAETAYFADEGKLTATGFRPDIRPHSMPSRWLQKATMLSPVDLPSFARPTSEDATDWLLVSLKQQRYPPEQPEFEQYFGEQAWKEVVDSLVARNLVSRGRSQRAVLTAAGRSRATAYIEGYRRAPSSLPFSIRVEPITSRTYVDASNPWEVVTTEGLRTVVGLEMEAGSVAFAAWAHEIPYWLVAKGVMDHAMSDKSTKGADRYKHFAARASAEVVWKFLADRRLNDPTSVSHLGGPASSPVELREGAGSDGLLRGTLPASNLKPSGNAFVDRKAPRKECVSALRGGTRLITVYGPSGSGKSRLAAEIARDVRDDFDDRVYVVDLSVISDPELVLRTVLQVLQVEPGDPLIDALREAFRDLPVLLILENLEHVATAADRVQDLLDVAPDLRIIVTSETPLQLETERRVEAKSLLPDDGAQLFLARAQRSTVTEDDLVRVRELCSILKEPLAIELAADYARASTIGELQRVLELPEFLDLEIRVKGAPERHRTLASAIRWSFDCLMPTERAIFTRLSLLEGAWTEAAATALVGDFTGGRSVQFWLSPLVERRFVLREAPSSMEASSTANRFTMLFAIRAFGRTLLLADPALHRQVRAAHASHFLEVVESHTAQLEGPDRLDACAELALDHSNIHAALEYFIEHNDVAAALKMAVVLDTYWWSRSYAEGYARLTAVLDLDLPQDATGGDWLRRGQACVAAGKLALRRCDLDHASALFDEARRIARAWSEPKLEAIATERGALVDIERARYEAAKTSLIEALQMYTAMGPEGQEGRADCLNDLGTVGCELDDDDVEQHFDEALEIYGEVAGPQASAWVRIDKAQAAYLRGDTVRARVHAEYVQAVGRKYEESGLLMWSGNTLGHVAASEGDLISARNFFAESLTFATLQGNLRVRLRALEGFVVVAAQDEQFGSALSLLAAIDPIRKRRGLPRAATEIRLIEQAVARSRAEFSEADITRHEDRGSLMGLDQATEFARAI